MKKVICTLVSLFVLSLTCVYAEYTKAQEQEVKAFKKQNKEMLKALKGTYGEQPVVCFKNNGAIYLTVPVKVGKQVVSQYLFNDAGEILYEQPLSGIYSFDNGAFGIMTENKWGVITEAGKSVIPCQYNSISYLPALSEGGYTYNNKTLYRNESAEVYVLYDANNHSTFTTTDGQTVLGEYDQPVTHVLDAYWTLNKKASNNNDLGLLSNDGKLICEAKYSNFYFNNHGYVTTEQIVDNVKLKGAKPISPALIEKLPEVPAKFYNVDIESDESHFQVKCHRWETLSKFNPDSNYVISYKDRGERLYDFGHYDEVLTFYEGEGYGAPWGYYYMGCAAYELAEKEYKIMLTALELFKDKKTNFLPLQYPDKYDFNTNTMITMYQRSATNLEKYIQLPTDTVNQDFHAEARALRGKVMQRNNTYLSTVEEYTKEKAVASVEYETYKAQLEYQEAQRRAQQQATSNAIGNLIGAGLRSLLK